MATIARPNLDDIVHARYVEFPQTAESIPHGLQYLSQIYQLMNHV